MGAVLSCCRDHDSDENDPLLQGQQNGYGENSGDDYNALQRQMKEHEERMQARDESLKEIVSNTNDKLIDISMISNSGIVIQGSDLRQFQREKENAQSEAQGHLENDDAKPTHADSKYVPLDPKDSLSEDMRQQLRALHKAIFDELERQLNVENDQSLAVSLKN